MGIHGLFKFVADSAPLSVKETKVESYTGRTVAVDASMCLYQFLVAVRQGDQQSNLSNAAGDVTSHIQGFLGRTVKLLELGIKPVYVFDGKPPELKSKELAGRQQKKAEAAAELEAAIASGDAEEIRKQAARTSRANGCASSTPSTKRTVGLWTPESITETCSKPGVSITRTSVPPGTCSTTASSGCPRTTGTRH